MVVKLPNLSKLRGVFAFIFALLLLSLEAEILGQPRAAGNIFLFALFVLLLVIVVRRKI